MENIKLWVKENPVKAAMIAIVVLAVLAALGGGAA